MIKDAHLVKIDGTVSKLKQKKRMQVFNSLCFIDINKIHKELAYNMINKL